MLLAAAVVVAAVVVVIVVVVIVVVVVVVVGVLLRRSSNSLRHRAWYIALSSRISGSKYIALVLVGRGSGDGRCFILRLVFLLCRSSLLDGSK